MDLEATKNLLIDWVKHKSCITKMWLYGSRITGTYRDDSDLDVAIEFHFDDENEDFNSQVLEALHKYRSELKNLFDVTLHLEWNGGATETPYVDNYVSKKSILIYTKT